MQIRSSLVVRLTIAVAVVFAAAFASPAGAAAPRDPVIIVAGTFAGQGAADVYYAPLAARLRADGYQAYIFGLPGSGLGDIADTSAALNAFSDQVRAQTGGHASTSSVIRRAASWVATTSSISAARTKSTA